MKKWMLLFLCVILFSGCGKKENKTTTFLYEEDHYQIAFPYLESVSNQYSLMSYDTAETEKMLMKLSREYFKTNNSLYQEGQYLKEEELKTLLDRDHFNNIPEINTDGRTIKPNYTIAIQEQNYLGTNGTLKGISLALVLQSSQPYQNQYGATLYHEIEESVLLEYGKQKAQEIVTYLQKKEGLGDIKYIVGLYLARDPHAILPGTFRILGVSNNKTLTFSPLSYQYEYLDQTHVMEMDMNTYTNFQTLKTKMKEQLGESVYISAIGLYDQHVLKEIKLDIHKSLWNQSSLLALSRVLKEQIPQLFAGDVAVTVLATDGVSTKALFVKQNNTEMKTYFMEE